ncbi:hypothetical protein VB713_14570 [Anabaena cylindrica UHCC 0172]|uniref:hypothetical protein n=1 Tax=Anabaena cylindrica TaxID=1165 RepID=UPI002B1EDC6E|nr:hypothetical protein [Anabaena cylindrica]MEA5552166.1 hypothetical protein [Anabaena cylindrica UHCC 0172]
MYYADMAVHGKDRHLQLLVEVKNKRGASKIWAAKMRRNMYAHGLLPEAPFFLLALPEKFYLWKNIGLSTDLIEPDYEINPEPFLKSYYPKAYTQNHEISSEGFELIVSAWLHQILTIPSVDLLPPNMDWLVSSGLFDAIHYGHLKLEELV